MQSKKLCYSCSDNMLFQMIGQTKEFPTKLKELVKTYKENEIISCDFCERKVQYIRDEVSNRLTETEI